MGANRGKRRDRKHRRRGYNTAKATPQHAAVVVLPKVEPAPALEDGQRWHVVRVNVKCEEKAESGLRDLGFVTYRPRYTDKRVRKGKAVEFTRHLFPRYLFVAFDPKAESWYPILRTDGVEALLRSRTSFQPIAIPTGFVNGLAGEAETALAPDPKPIIVPGQVVRVEEGPFASFEAEVAAVQSEQRVEILVNVFGRLTPVVMPLSGVSGL